MKRSEINNAYLQAREFFFKKGWAILPHFRWDVTDFGLGNFRDFGLVLINLAEEPEYCEKLMYARKNMCTPLHYHKKKKEDIICRTGTLALRLYPEASKPESGNLSVKINGTWATLNAGETLTLTAGERVTITPKIWHTFWPISDECIIGEVSTANDDLRDNFFDNPDVGRYPTVEEDETPLIVLISDGSKTT